MSSHQTYRFDDRFIVRLNILYLLMKQLGSLSFFRGLILINKLNPDIRQSGGWQSRFNTRGNQLQPQLSTKEYLIMTLPLKFDNPEELDYYLAC